VPDESIIDPWSVSLAFAADAIRAGATIELGWAVDGIEDVGDVHRLAGTRGDVVHARWVVNVAGLLSDQIDRLFGHDGFHVTPRRGQLLVFDKFARRLLSSIVLPVPTERTKGVLVAPTVFGNVLLGPTAEDVADPADTASTAEGIEALLVQGRRILPSLLDEEVTATYAGLRAATEHRDYQVASHPADRYICIGGIRSTGLTASMAIARHVGELLAQAGLVGDALDDDLPTGTVPPLGEHQVRPARDEAAIAADPAYGRIACHCEQVSVGEVRDAFGTLLPPSDMGGLRRRTRAGNGRCQGFSCATTLLDLADAAGVDLDGIGAIG
jgi:glycerol-3-phosphate dehydrogenase